MNSLRISHQLFSKNILYFRTYCRVLSAHNTLFLHNLNSKNSSFKPAYKWFNYSLFTYNEMIFEKNILNEQFRKYCQNVIINPGLYEDNDYLVNLLNRISTNIKERNVAYKMDTINAINNISGQDKISFHDSVMLIKCCSHIMLDVGKGERQKLLYRIWGILQNRIDFRIEHYIEFIKAFTDNKFLIDAKDFINKMLPLKPDITIYELLLQNICQKGEMDRALEILELLKNSNIPLSVICHNNLIEGYAVSGNFKKVFEKINDLKTTSDILSSGTRKSILKAYIFLGNKDKVKEEINYSIQNSIVYGENQVADIINCLLRNNMEAFLPECLHLFSSEAIKAPNMSTFLKFFCIKLIYQGYLKSAYFLCINLFNTEDISEVNAFSKIMIREAVKNYSLSSDIIYVCNDLKKSGLNEYAIQTACEASLKFGNVKLAIELLKLMKEDQLPIRCHYFWPLFIMSSKINGEIGIFNIICLMQELKVFLDHETLIEYVLPNINLLYPQDVMKKLSSHGISNSLCLTPLTVTLLKNDRTRDAAELCELIEGKIDCGLLIYPLLMNYILKPNVDSVHNILKAFNDKPQQPNIDWIGKFLVSFVNNRKWKTDIKLFVDLINVLNESSLKISSEAGEICTQYLNQFEAAEKLTENAKNTLLLITDNESPNIFFHGSVMKKPDSMNLNELEAHLIELEEKKLNTRGILRKLLQQYCRKGDYENAKIIIAKCEKEKVSYSSGMKALIIDLFVKTKDSKKAMQYFLDLQKSDPSFSIDEHKIIDFATLLIKDGDINSALNILKTQAIRRQIRGGYNIEKNCWKLLNTLAQSEHSLRTEEVLNSLIKMGYCKYSNILFGPIIRGYLYRSDIKGAVLEYEKCINIYKKAPLKHEILCKLIKGSSNIKNDDDKISQTEYQKMLEKIQNINIKLYGTVLGQLSLIIALADSNMNNQLKRLLLDPSLQLNWDALLEQCKNLAFYNTEALMNLIECFDSVRYPQIKYICFVLIKAYNNNNDCDAILKLWNKIQEKEIKLTDEMINMIFVTLKSNKLPIPISILGEMKEDKKMHLQ